MAAFSAPSLLAAALLASAAAAPAWPPCGWPTIEENYPRPAKLQTRIAQRLLNVTPVDGVFGPSTAAAARAFQTAHGLQPDGGVGSQTWPVLAATVTPTRAGARNSGAVAAAQDALQAAGFYAGALSGNFDAATASSLAVFAAARGAVDTSGQAIDAQLWHLLVSGCNSSLATERFWIDVGWPQGSLSTSTLACLRGFFEFVVFECWLERSAWFAPCVQNIANARAGGFAAVGAYMFPVRALDPSAQAAWMVSNLTAAGAKVDLIMLDIEGDDWVSDNRTQADNRAFVTALRAGLDKKCKDKGLSPAWSSYEKPSFTLDCGSQVVTYDTTDHLNITARDCGVSRERYLERASGIEFVVGDIMALTNQSRSNELVEVANASTAEGLVAGRAGVWRSSNATSKGYRDVRIDLQALCKTKLVYVDASKQVWDAA